MKFKHLLLAVLCCGLLITSLFYKQSFGLNLFLFDLLLMSWLILNGQLKWRHPNEILLATGFILSGLFTVLTFSVFSYMMHFVTAFLFIGVLNYSKVRSLVTALGLSFSSIIQAPVEFVSQWSKSNGRGRRYGSLLWRARIFVLPILVVGVFIVIYSFSNPFFGDMVNSMGTGMENGVTFLFEGLDLGWISTFVLSLLISVYLLVRARNKEMETSDTIATNNLVRTRSKIPRRFGLTALKNEYKAGIFLLVVLNLLLLTLNVMDMYWVWFNFAWEGQTLKQYVHEGTYMLIFSILISIGVVLFFFRRNLNFYSKNKWLKILSYAWIAQNGILAISVAVRNLRYIEYFSLAYKRIGVVIFLLLVGYGLYTVFRKIRDKKSTYFLFRTNARAAFVILLVASFINWDGVIARYNFAHAPESYLHLSYVSRLSDKALPELD
ncbi:MAG: DUF4173 domain-containing protein, partial [Bacteroidota bacterium]